MAASRQLFSKKGPPVMFDSILIAILGVALI